ncbi:MAG: M16 family metallopeptidase [Thermoguttaceae bacterium]
MTSNRLPNDITLLVDTVPRAGRVACLIHLACGTACEEATHRGITSILGEVLQRGAGEYSAREMTFALERLGVVLSVRIGSESLLLSAAMPTTSFAETLRLLAVIVRQPHLDEDEFETARQLQILELQALQDEPSRRLTHHLAEQFFGDPWGRSPLGTIETVEALTYSDLVAHFKKRIRPSGAAICVAGDVESVAVLREVEAAFGDWRGDAVSLPTTRVVYPKCSHVDAASEQTHIGVAYPVPPFSDPDWLTASVGLSVLDGGMSGRLFDALREQRGLCYAVSGRCVSLRDRAAAFCQCATTQDRAAESCDVLLGEIDRLKDGITESEFQRVKLAYRAATLTDQETVIERSATALGEWSYIGRVRSLTERLSEIESLSRTRVNDYLATNHATKKVVVTLGTLPCAIAGV